MSKTVKIEVEVEVPEGAKWIAVDGTGQVICSATKPKMSVTHRLWYSLTASPKVPTKYRIGCDAFPRVPNWRETLKRID